MRSLLVLRPEPGASRTVALASAMGLVAEAAPLFKLRALDWSLPEGTFDGLLLTSANAVRLARSLPALPVHAVGQATAEAAATAGAKVETVGSGGVDDLLACLDRGLRLLHLAGEERIVPERREPEVIAVPVYRAEPLPLPGPGTVAGKVLLVHSPAAGRRLDHFAGPRGAVRIAAISPAAAAACGTGWEQVGAAEAPNDRALLSLAAQLCKD